ncbi:hypothetical protein BDB01DRAFT_793856 [Pilobolus umbonatus]|nr:hypothetical protein BDB01DRAFT_793856 [Pilobolus umbonatus]
MSLCYRCRKSCQEIECDYCHSYWHRACVDEPIHRPWICPRHPEHSQIVMDCHDIPDDVVTFEETEEISKYGGIVYSIPAKSIENEFLQYAKRYRSHVDSSNEDTEDYTETEEWLENISTHHDYYGIQMLLDAASKDEDVHMVDMEEQQRYEAIEELIRLKGEDFLLKVLSE